MSARKTRSQNGEDIPGQNGGRGHGRGSGRGHRGFRGRNLLWANRQRQRPSTGQFGFGINTLPGNDERPGVTDFSRLIEAWRSQPPDTQERESGKIFNIQISRLYEIKIRKVILCFRAI